MAVSKMNRGDLIVKGRCDGMGELTPAGSYVRIVYSNDLGDYGLTVSEGAAAVLVDELRAAISPQPNMPDANKALQEARAKVQAMKARTDGPQRADWQLGYAAACREIDDMLRQMRQ